MIRRILATLLVLCAVLLPSAAFAPPQVEPADLVLTNAKVITVDDLLPEAQAVGVRGDRIVALGSVSDVRQYVGPATRVVDLQGQLVIPGFIEGHGHFTGVGDELGSDCRDGRRSREDGEAGRVDHRPRLAPGEMDCQAESEC